MKPFFLVLKQTINLFPHNLYIRSGYVMVGEYREIRLEIKHVRHYEELNVYYNIIHELTCKISYIYEELPCYIP